MLLNPVSTGQLTQHEQALHDGLVLTGVQFKLSVYGWYFQVSHQSVFMTQYYSYLSEAVRDADKVVREYQATPEGWRTAG